MLANGKFTIEFPLLIESPETAVIADGCDDNTNYYTDGLHRGTCCCSCDKKEL